MQLVDFEVVEHQFIIVLILEYANVSLEKYLKHVERDGGRLTLVEINQIWRQMVRGVAAVHTGKVVPFEWLLSTVFGACSEGVLWGRAKNFSTAYS